MQIRWTMSRAEQSRAEQSRAEHGLISAPFAAQKRNIKTKAYSARGKRAGYAFLRCPEGGENFLPCIHCSVNQA